MRFHCNKCGRDFTTLAERDKARKFNLTHFVIDKMSCPNCHASNWHMHNGSSRWHEEDNDGYREPAIVVFEACQKRMVGNVFSPEGMSVNCDGCRHAFNCLTGNVDDGQLETDDPDYVQKRAAEKLEKAKQAVAKKVRDDALEALNQLRKRMGKINFGYEFKNQMWYCRFGGTVWKLTDDDVQAICTSKWCSPNTTVIKRTFDKKGINSALARVLLVGEITEKNKSGA